MFQIGDGYRLDGHAVGGQFEDAPDDQVGRPHLAEEIGEHLFQRAIAIGLGQDGGLAGGGDQDLGFAGLFPDVAGREVFAEVPLDQVVHLTPTGFPAWAERLFHRLERDQQGLALLAQV